MFRKVTNWSYFAHTTTVKFRQGSYHPTLMLNTKVLKNTETTYEYDYFLVVGSRFLEYYGTSTRLTIVLHI